MAYDDVFDFHYHWQLCRNKYKLTHALYKQYTLKIIDLLQTSDSLVEHPFQMGE